MAIYHDTPYLKALAALQYPSLNPQVNVVQRGDRTGTGTRAYFGEQMRFNLREGFPLLTTKKVNFSAVAHELLWFLSGSTNINDLNSKIWNEWATEDGELGPVYGRQWRSWPTYKRALQNSHYGMYAKDTPIDQMGQLIENLKTKPYSRRHVISAWNPTVLPDEELSPQENAMKGNMALAPCHCLFQFFVAPLSLVQRLELLVKHMDLLSEKEEFWLERILEKQQEPIAPSTHEIMVNACDRMDVPVHELSCQMYQRSADICLGVPFNIASYALLTHLVASVCNMEVGDYIHTFGDIHLYNNHVEGAAEQLTRTPLASPKVVINPAVKSIDMFTINDITLEGYEHHPPIKFDVSV